MRIMMVKKAVPSMRTNSHCELCISKAWQSNSSILKFRIAYFFNLCDNVVVIASVSVAIV